MTALRTQTEDRGIALYDDATEEYVGIVEYAEDRWRFIPTAADIKKYIDFDMEPVWWKEHKAVEYFALSIWVEIVLQRKLAGAA